MVLLSLGFAVHKLHRTESLYRSVSTQSWEWQENERGFWSLEVPGYFSMNSRRLCWSSPLSAPQLRTGPASLGRG